MALLSSPFRDAGLLGDPISLGEVAGLPLPADGLGIFTLMETSLFSLIKVREFQYNNATILYFKTKTNVLRTCDFFLYKSSYRHSRISKRHSSINKNNSESCHLSILGRKYECKKSVHRVLEQKL